MNQIFIGTLLAFAFNGSVRASGDEWILSKTVGTKDKIRTWCEIYEDKVVLTKITVGAVPMPFTFPSEMHAVVLDAFQQQDVIAFGSSFEGPVTTYKARYGEEFDLQHTGTGVPSFKIDTESADRLREFVDQTCGEGF